MHLFLRLTRRVSILFSLLRSIRSSDEVPFITGPRDETGIAGVKDEICEAILGVSERFVAGGVRWELGAKTIFSSSSS